MRKIEFCTVENMLGWGYLDVNALETRLAAAANLGIDSFDIQDDIKSYEGEIGDINSWFFSTIHLTFYRVTEKLREMVTEKYEDDEISGNNADILMGVIQELEDSFSPFINCLDSWANNLLDDFDLSGDNVIEDILDRLIEENCSEEEEGGEI